MTKNSDIKQSRTPTLYDLKTITQNLYKDYPTKDWFQILENDATSDGTRSGFINAAQNKTNLENNSSEVKVVKKINSVFLNLVAHYNQLKFIALSKFEFGLENISSMLEIIITSGVMGIWSGLRSKIEKNYLEESRLKAHYFLFKQENNLLEEPYFPENITNQWIIIGFTLITDAVLNMYLFAQGNDFGIVGGFLLAVAFSTVNIGFALSVGIGSRNLNLKIEQISNEKIRKNRRIIRVTYIAIIAYTPLILFIFMYVAHYRMVLGLTQVNPNTIDFMLGVTKSITLNTFRLNLESWIMLFLNIFLHIFTLYKSYHLDDKYPSYGKLYRRLSKQSDKIEKNKLQLDTSFIREKLQASEKIDQYFQELTTKLDMVSSNLEIHKNVLNTLKYTRNDLFDHLKNIIGKYRDGYRKAIAPNTNAKEPNYFAQDILDSLIKNLTDEEAKLQKYREEFINCENQYYETLLKINETKVKLIQKLDAVHAEINEKIDTIAARSDTLYYERYQM